MGLNAALWETPQLIKVAALYPLDALNHGSHKHPAKSPLLQFKEFTLLEGRIT